MKKNYHIKTIGFFLYEDFDSLDSAGPNQVFHFMGGPDADHPLQIFMFGPKKGEPVKSLEGLHWVADLGYGDPLTDKDGNTVNNDVLDMIFVPGGYGEGFNRLLKYEKTPFYRALRARGQKVQLLTSVCTGSLLLARAGLLDGFQCTTHWAFRDSLRLFPNVDVVSGFPRYVIDGNRVTGGGISSGIDEALAIAELLKEPEAAFQIQMTMQYIPNPPFNCVDLSVGQQMIEYMDNPDNWNATVYNIVKNIPQTTR